MSRYVMNWGGEVEFNAHDEFEIFEIIKRSLRINATNEEESLSEFQEHARSWMGRDYGVTSIRSVVQNMLNQNLIANISCPSSCNNSQLISDWCKTAFDSAVDTGLISSRQFKAIQKVAAEIREIANQPDEQTVTDALACYFDPIKFEGYDFADRFEYLPGAHLPVLGLLNFIHEFLKSKCELQSDFSCCHAIFYTQFPPVLHKFANFWEFTLGLEMQKEFFSAGLLLFADFLSFNSNVRPDLYTDYAPVTRIPEHANLYFAYGSNMDMQQMKTRCPSAKFVGLSNIKNFDYYIDARGVASLRPKVGATAYGILWDIRDPDDWQKLDYYEGVHHDNYRRHYIQDEDLAGDQRCAVYISTTASVGEPRHNYQEKIVRSVYELKDHLLNEYDIMKGNSLVEQAGCWSAFEQEMNYWTSEMKDWLRA